MLFTKSYSSTPTVLISANHSTNIPGNSIHNGITTWIEVKDLSGVNIFEVCCKGERAFCSSLKKSSINAVNRCIDNVRNWMLKPEGLMINDDKTIMPDGNKTVDNKLILHVVLLLVNMTLI